MCFTLALFNIHTDDLVREWKKDALKGIQIAQDKFLSSMLFDDVIIQESEDKLQLSKG